MIGFNFRHVYISLSLLSSYLSDICVLKKMITFCFQLSKCYGHESTLLSHCNMKMCVLKRRIQYIQAF